MHGHRSQTGGLGHVMQRVSEARSAPKPHKDPNLCPDIRLSSPSHAQWLFFSLTSPNYNGILIPHTSPGHVATRVMAKTFSFSFLFFFLRVKNEKDIRQIMCFVTHKTVAPREASGAKNCIFKRVWVSTLLNGLDGSPCMPDGAVYKAVTGTLRARKIFKHFWAYWTMISYTCFFQYNRDK